MLPACDVSGGFVSQQTAIHPEQLASRFADAVLELWGGHTLSLPDAISSLPVKQLLDPPFTSQDGGGVFPSRNGPCRPKTQGSFSCFPSALMQHLACLSLCDLWQRRGCRYLLFLRQWWPTCGSFSLQGVIQRALWKFRGTSLLASRIVSMLCCPLLRPAGRLPTSYSS